MNERRIISIKYYSSIYSDIDFEQYNWDGRLIVKFDNNEKYEFFMKDRHSLQLRAGSHDDSKYPDDILSEDELKTINDLLEEKDENMYEVDGDLAEQINFSKEIELTDKLWIEEYQNGV